MNVTAISPEVPINTEHLKQTHAASDFEALLIGQMLKSMRNENSGWLGTGDDQSADAAFGLGEEELAKSLASHGGFGLARLIESGLRASAGEPADHADTAKR
jgi:Rod binding domain-containing protein